MCVCVCVFLVLKRLIKNNIVIVMSRGPPKAYPEES